MGCYSRSYKPVNSTVRLQWINDDYIVYTAMFSTLPAVIQVTENDQNRENILLMPEYDDTDYYYGSSEHEFTIEEVRENTIILKDNAVNAKKEFWEFNYIIDENGEFTSL